VESLAKDNICMPDRERCGSLALTSAESEANGGARIIQADVDIKHEKKKKKKK